MKNIVLAAGYATRLYPLTENFPKPLLQFGEGTILGRLLDDVDGFAEINEHIIVTNHRFADIFRQWVEDQHLNCPVRVIDDGTVSNEGRLGAVCDLLLALEECKVDEDILVMAGDNILDFSLRGFLDFAREKGTSAIMCFNEPELRLLQRCGVVVVDADMKVLSMEEKPIEPASHWAVPPFYIYKRSDLPLVRDCLNHGCGYDAPGNLPRYLCSLTPIHAYPMPGSRHDIGSLDSYAEAKKLLG